MAPVEYSTGAVTKRAIDENATRQRKHACLRRQGRQARQLGPCGWIAYTVCSGNEGGVG